MITFHRNDDFYEDNDAVICWRLIICSRVLIKDAYMVMLCVYYVTEELCDVCCYYYIITNTFIHGMTSRRGV